MDIKCYLGEYGRRKEGKYIIMSEKVIGIRRSSLRSRAEGFCKDSLVWGAAGLLLELSSSQLSAAPTAAALAAGLSGGRCMSVVAGGILGALLHGVPDGLIGIAALVIILAARLLPNVRNVKACCAIRTVATVFAVFFSRCAEVHEPSELVLTFVAALTSGAFTLCVCYLSEVTELKGFEISDHADCATAAAVVWLSFMALGELSYSFANVGRLIAAFVMLAAVARFGFTYGVAFSLAAVSGIVCVDSEAGMGAAVMAVAMLLSSLLSRYGKLTRAIGFVFFGTLGILVAGIEAGSWRIFVELITAAALFAILPVERAGASESQFTDNTVSMLMRERLFFAADALAGVSRGLNAAADTLDRKYCMSLEQVADAAADRACKTCPNNMKCWGECYDLFHAEFGRLVQLKRSGKEISELTVSPAASEICCNKGGIIRAIQYSYGRYVAATGDDRKIREMRKIYTEQLTSMQDILRDMGYTASHTTSGNRGAERRAEQVLVQCGLKSPKAYVSFDKKGRMHMEAYCMGQVKTETSYLGELLISALGRELELPEIHCSGDTIRVTAVERSRLCAEIGAYQLSKGSNSCCGDYFESFLGADGAFYVVLSDGMGSGSRARIDSTLACTMLTKLIKSGIPLTAALETVNTSMRVKSADESYATLDICRIDLNSGEGVLYKAGAATTYIKQADKLVRAALASAPVGVGGRLNVPVQRFRVDNGDVIIMTTDGVSVDEGWLSRELSTADSPKLLSERIARSARTAENGRDDDISVIAVAVSR